MADYDNTRTGIQYVLNSQLSAAQVAAGQQPLRIVFSVDTYMQLVYWTADITIYNLSRDSRSIPPGTIQGGNVGNANAQWLNANIQVQSGDAVTLSAGYEQGTYGQFTPNSCLLFSGIVFQPIWTRVNVVDRILKLRCIFGLIEDTLNLLSFNMPAGATYYDTFNRIAQEATGDPKNPWVVDFGTGSNLDQSAVNRLQNTSLPGAQVLDGKPYQLVQNIMRQSTLFSWVTPAPPGSKSGTPATIHVRSFEDEPTVADAIYAPPNLPSYPLGARPTLLDIPQQTVAAQVGVTQYGVTFRVLLDPTIRNGQVVQLAQGTVVNPYEFTPISDYPPVPSRNAMYIVSGVRHVGDSRGRGEDWYTEINGTVWNFFPSFFMASSPSGASPSVGQAESVIG